MNTDMTNLDVLFNMMTLGGGAYCIWVWFKLHTGKKLFQSQLLIPKAMTPEDCLDPEEYIAYIAPRTLIAGVLLFLNAAFLIVDSRYTLIATWLADAGSNVVFFVHEAFLVFGLAVLVWFGACWMKAKKLYW